MKPTNFSLYEYHLLVSFLVDIFQCCWQIQFVEKHNSCKLYMEDTLLLSLV